MEQIRQLKEISERYDCFYVVTRTKATEAMKQRRYIVSDLVRKNRTAMLFRMLKMVLEQFIVFFQRKTGCYFDYWRGRSDPYVCDRENFP